MNLKPQDILFLLKLVALDKKPWSFNKIAIELGMSASEVHAAAGRCLGARLAVKEANIIWPNVCNLLEFLEHGIQYVFVPERGEMSQGTPTAYPSSSMESLFVKEHEPPSVWSDPEGDVRGESFSPLYKSVPTAAKNDPQLYELLSLVDAIRGGTTEVRKVAIKVLKKRLSLFQKDMLVIAGIPMVSRAALKKLVVRYHIKRLELFGSAARGELRSGSDIDLLVEFEKGKAPSLAGMEKIKADFSVLFGGRMVDVATSSILNNPYRQQEIIKDREVLYAA